MRATAGSPGTRPRGSITRRRSPPSIRRRRSATPSAGRIWLKVNDAIRQDADIAELTWKVPEIIAELSTYFTLQPGDLIFTGTPAGVGALQPGDTIESGIEGFETLRNRIVAAG